MKDIANLDNLYATGKITEEASTKLGQVFSELGHLAKDTNKLVTNLAIGAAGVIRIVGKLADEGKTIKNFEIVEYKKAWNERRMDILTSDGVLYEVKGWKVDSTAAIARLGGGLDPTRDKQVSYSNQLLKDLVSIAKPDSTVVKQWRFSDEALEASKPAIVAGLHASISGGKSELADKLKSKLGYNKKQFESFLEDDLQELLETLMKVN